MRGFKAYVRPTYSARWDITVHSSEERYCRDQCDAAVYAPFRLLFLLWITNWQQFPDLQFTLPYCKKRGRAVWSRCKQKSSCENLSLTWGNSGLIHRTGGRGAYLLFAIEYWITSVENSRVVDTVRGRCSPQCWVMYQCRKSKLTSRPHRSSVDWSGGFWRSAEWKDFMRAVTYRGLQLLIAHRDRTQHSAAWISHRRGRCPAHSTTPCTLFSTLSTRTSDRRTSLRFGTTALEKRQSMIGNWSSP